MKFAIGIETKKRPTGVDYFGQTLKNLDRAGVFKSPLLASLSVTHGEDCTRQQNAARAIAAATQAAKFYGCEWVMKLEDDLDFTDQFLENVAGWLADFGHANTPMFSLAATFEFVSRSRFANNERTVFEPGESFGRVREYIRRGEHVAPHPVNGYWGAQALVWKTEMAEHLVKFLGDDPALFDGKMHHRNRGHDLLLQVWGNELGAKHFAVAVPSFVQHVGEQSNLDQPELGHKQPFFQFPFAGHDYRYERRLR